MLATEARKNASEIIWDSLPYAIRYYIENAVNEGQLMCEIIFTADKVDEFNKCIKYFENLNELGYRAAMHKTSDHYVITIMW